MPKPPSASTSTPHPDPHDKTSDILAITAPSPSLKTSAPLASLDALALDSSAKYCDPITESALKMEVSRLRGRLRKRLADA